jgi:hypothetical protein
MTTLGEPRWWYLPWLSMRMFVKILWSWLRFDPARRHALVALVLLVVVSTLLAGPLTGGLALVTGCVTSIAGQLVMLILYRLRVGGRVLLVHRSPVGTALATGRQRSDANGTSYWEASNLVSWPARGIGTVSVEERPGRLLVDAIVCWARSEQVDLRLTAANTMLAENLYRSAGFTYMPNQTGLKRPRMCSRPHSAAA